MPEFPSHVFAFRFYSSAAGSLAKTDGGTFWLWPIHTRAETDLSSNSRRGNRAHTFHDLGRLSRRRAPPSPFEVVPQDQLPVMFECASPGGFQSPIPVSLCRMGLGDRV